MFSSSQQQQQQQQHNQEQQGNLDDKSNSNSSSNNNSVDNNSNNRSAANETSLLMRPKNSSNRTATCCDSYTGGSLICAATGSDDSPPDMELPPRMEHSNSKVNNSHDDDEEEEEEEAPSSPRQKSSSLLVFRGKPWRSHCRRRRRRCWGISGALVLLLSVSLLVLWIVLLRGQRNEQQQEQQEPKVEQEQEYLPSTETAATTTPSWQTCRMLSSDANNPSVNDHILAASVKLTFQEIWIPYMDDHNITDDDDDDDETNSTKGRFAWQAHVQRASSGDANTTATNPSALCILALTPKDYFSGDDDDAMTISTTTEKSSGLLFWQHQPLARSYNGFDWERHAGTNWIRSSQVHINCTAPAAEDADNDGAAVGCVITLPPIDSDDQVYSLTSYLAPSPIEQEYMNHIDDIFVASPHRRNEYARFLEQATFGVTKADLEYLSSLQVGTAAAAAAENSITTTTPSTTTTTTSLTTNNRNMAYWIHEQQTMVEPTLHRAYFRRRVNAPFLSSQEYGLVTHPCQADAFYRQWTFSAKHLRYYVNITRVSNNDSSDSNNEDERRILSLNGQIMTVVDGPLYHRYYSTYTQYEDNESHLICSRPNSGVGSDFKLWSNTHHRCLDVIVGDPIAQPEDSLFHGNPPIRFDASIGFVPDLVVSLDDAPGVVEPVPLDQDFFSKHYPTPYPSIVKISHALTDDACSSVYYGHGASSVVFGLFQGEYYVHDPRFLLHENTLESPWDDGGGQIMKQTKGPVPEYEAKCSNVPRTFLNEDTCFLSSSLDACSYKSTISARVGEYGHGVVVCGSPGEVANDLRLGAGRGMFDLPTTFNETSVQFTEQRNSVWASLFLWAKDQLRQRVAWALFQLLVISGSIEGNSMTEEFVYYYDIMVRHAFGSYRDLLKEVAFSRSMAEMLSFVRSISTGYQWIQSTSGVVEYPDENFAREIMQLFTIGLYELNRDGTPKIINGKTVRTYSNDDIMEFARVWTGFNGQSYRGNAAAQSNRIDPMYIEAHWRDPFPKLGLRSQYIGHGYPLCTDLPHQHFLKRGAKYRLLGYDSLPELQKYDTRWLDRPDEAWFLANQTAGTAKSLYGILCGAKLPSNPCSYPPVVTLSENIPCHGTEECSVDSIGTVKVGDIFYEYIQPPCVQHAFFENAQKIKKRDWFEYDNMYMCADPRTEVAAVACCLNEGEGDLAYDDSLYWGELVKLSTAQTRCKSKDSSSYDSAFGLCTSTGLLGWDGGWAYGTPYFWFGNVPCNVQAKLDTDGKVAIVHTVPDEDPNGKRQRQMTDHDTKTFFRVLWSDPSQVKSFVQNCFSPCEVTQDDYCLCTVSTTDEIVFGDSTPSRQEVLSELVYGAFHPDVYDVPYETIIATDNVTVYTILGTGEKVFEVVDDFGVLQRRKNLRSTVQLVGTDLSFPNPVHFVSLAVATERDALYETDAALDQLLYHENTAPFIAKHLAQRFHQSNPTPRYIEAIAEAFIKGRYNYDDGSGTSISFGQGSYGDLAATIAAVLLDREARSLVLDRDPAHGSMKEPILKLFGVMRGLEFVTTPEYPFPDFNVDLQQAIGQNVFSAPSIFSYFLPEYEPSGVVSEAGLVSPEAEVHSNPKIIATLNGLMTMMKYGLDRCFGGFGQMFNWDSSSCENRTAGVFDIMAGYLGYQPFYAETIVDEMATIMTSGRLSARNRAIVQGEVDNEPNPVYAAVKAQQLIATTSEFHTTGTVQPSDEMRQSNKAKDSPQQTYKGVVLAILRGGYDSYNLIVPKTCSGTNAADQTIDEQYNQVRGAIQVYPEERTLSISAEGSGQPCEEFAIHPRMPILQELYNQDDLCFFMNTGLLNQPVTKDNYEALTVSQLFAHNAMQLELQKVDPYRAIVRSGFLGRLTHILNGPSYNFSAQTLGVNLLWPAVTGNQTLSPSPVVMSEMGAQRFNTKPSHETYDPRDVISELNSVNKMPSSVFGETWSQYLLDALEESELLADALDNVTLPSNCGSRQFNMAVQLMETRQSRGSDRDMIVIDYSGWDHHTNLKEVFDGKAEGLNEALSCFVDNLKLLNLWKNVTLMVMSDFGRTLSPNSNLGSDHGWAGHYFALGGALRGKKFYGEYPSDITEDGPFNSGRGRMIPTLSWESMLSGIMEWMGARVDDISSYVLPNLVQAGTAPISSAEMFLSEEELLSM